MLVGLETLKLYLYIPQIGQFARLNDVILKYLFRTQIPNFILHHYKYKLKNIKLLFFMYLVLKFLDLLLSEILSSSIVWILKLFGKDSRVNNMDIKYNNSLSQYIDLQELLPYDKYLLWL